MIRNLPPNGTAGLARQSVSSYRRLPCPPARINANVSRVSREIRRSSCTVMALFFVETQLSLSRIDAFGKAPVISRNIGFARMNIKSQKYILDACTLAIENAITSA